MKHVFLLMAVGTAITTAANAAVLGRAVSENAVDDNFISQTGTTLLLVNQEMFGLTSVDERGGVDGVPSPLTDRSTIDSAQDHGIIRSTEHSERFFGVARSSRLTGNQPGVATWTFDISGFSDLSVDIDMAMLIGDNTLNSQDVLRFTYSIDGGSAQSLFAFAQDGTLTTFTNEQDDIDGFIGFPNTFVPLTANGVDMTNNLSTYTAGVAGTGSELTITFEGVLFDSFFRADAFAFNNIVVNGIPTPGSAGLLALAGIVAARRRR